MTDTHRYLEPPTENVSNLGAALAAVATTSDDRDCLEVFADLLNLAADATRPHLLTVLLEPTGEAQILTVGHACPGLTIQINEDLQLHPIQLWFGENELRGLSPKPRKPDAT